MPLFWDRTLSSDYQILNRLRGTEENWIWLKDLREKKKTGFKTVLWELQIKMYFAKGDLCERIHELYLPLYVRGLPLYVTASTFVLIHPWQWGPQGTERSVIS